MLFMNLRRCTWLATGAISLAAGPSLAQSWLDTRGEIEELHAAGEVEAAAIRGDDYIDGIRQEFGPASAELSDSLLLLADLEMDLGDPVAAVESLLEAIEIFGPIEAPDSSKLSDAYLTLGDAYVAAGANLPAIEAYQQARDLSRRRLGLHTGEQIPILYRMSRAALNEGDFVAATGFRQDAHDTHVRVRLDTLRAAPAMDSRDPEEFLKARLDYGNALIDEGLVSDAVLAFTETLEIIEEEFDRSSRMRAEILLAQSGAVGANLVTLQKVRRIINLAIEPDPLLRAELRREWGDWRLLAGLPDKAERAYRESWKILETIDGGEALQREWYGEIEYIRDPGNGLLGAGILTLDPEAPQGQIALDFVVDPTGRAVNIRVASAHPAWLTGIAVQQVASSLFRPRFIDGQLVTTPGRYTWVFRYDPEVAGMFGIAPVALASGSSTVSYSTR
jgi:tetratricopeptide (TPR) repeat protein